MKKLVFILLSFTILTAGAQTVDDVIGKYSAKLGGLEAFNKIKSAKFTGTLTVQSNDLPMTIQVVNGKSVRTDTDVMGSQIINSYNNGKGWKQNPFGGAASPTDMTDAELADFKSQAVLAPVLMDYKSRGHKVELLGQEEVEGKKAFKIKLTNKDDGKITNYYINSADYLLIKSETDRDIQGQTATVESWYSDIKELSGVKFFMTRVQKVEGQELLTVKLSNAELNVTIDEKIFDKP